MNPPTLQAAPAPAPAIAIAEPPDAAWPRQAAATLIDVLARENAALAAMDLAGAAGLLAEKQRAAEALARAGTPSDLDPATLERLRDLAGDNQRLLQRAMTVQTRVIALIAGAAADHAATPRYGATGALAAIRSAPRALSARA